jgi:hypothetical protein
MKKIDVKNMIDLRNDLTNVYNSLRNNEIGVNEAKEAANVAGKIIGSAKTQIEYNKMVGSTCKISFMEP